MDFNQIMQNFQAAMLAHGITPPQQIIGDGKLYRFHVQGDKGGSKNGYYLLFINKISCGIFGTWKIGIAHRWCSKKREYMSSREYTEYKRQIEEAKLQHAAIRAKEQAEAARQAKHIFSSCPFADPDHLYLVRKCVKPFYARQKGSYLVLPIIDFDGNFHSLQYIAPTSDKWFLSSGVIAGHFIPIQHQPTNDRRILIAEGFSTSATLAEKYQEACVIAACSASNLKPVALHIRQYLPTAEIVIGADIDPDGLLKAREAARAASATIIKPKFPPGVSKKLTDFNDLYCLLGSGETQV